MRLPGNGEFEQQRAHASRLQAALRHLRQPLNEADPERRRNQRRHRERSLLRRARDELEQRQLLLATLLPQDALLEQPEIATQDCGCPTNHPHNAQLVCRLPGCACHLESRWYELLPDAS